MTDTLKLKALIVEKQSTQRKLAKGIGISVASLSLKIHNKREFLISEVAKIQELFSLSDEKIMDIFFAKNVDDKRNKA